MSSPLLFRQVSEGVSWRIVSKRADQPYRSGKNPGWVKVKTVAWREANEDRWELFQRTKSAPR